MTGQKRWSVHPDILKLGLVSLLTDLSSEMLFSVFALFLTTVAGASAALLGVVEGAADFAASSLDYLAGWSSDRTGKRKALALAGYAFSTLAKTILLVANSILALGAFRVIERLGKSLRGPPRDAWLAAVAAPGARGYSFGIHKALDKAGAVLGPLVAYAVLAHLGEHPATYRLLFALALVPAVASVALLSLVKERPATAHPRENPLRSWTALSPGFKRYLLVAGIFSLAYFSFSFLLLRAAAVGFAVKDIVLLYALFNLAFVACAPFIGRLGDRLGRRKILLLGYLTYFLMSLGFAFATRRAEVIALFVVYGVFYAVDEAQSKAFIADIEPDRRASAMGAYNFLTGLLYLPASLAAGALWLARPAYAFVLAAFLSLAAMAAFELLRPDRPRA